MSVSVASCRRLCYPSIKGDDTMPTPQEVWAMLQAHEGETFYTAKGLPFHYLIHGRELFVNQKTSPSPFPPLPMPWPASRRGRLPGRQSPAPRRSAATGLATFTLCFYNWASSICRRQTTNHCNKLQAHNRLHNLLCAFCMFCTKIGQNE